MIFIATYLCFLLVLNYNCYQFSNIMVFLQIYYSIIIEVHLLFCKHLLVSPF